MHRNLRFSHSRFILWICAVQMVVGGIFCWAWLSAGKLNWLRLFFDYQGTIYFVFLDILKVWLCIIVWKQFSRREPSRSMWLVISLAMGFQLSGDLLSHWLSVNTYINPLHYIGPGWNTSAASVLSEWGSVIAGPLFMATLAVGFYKGLHFYKQVGMRGKLKPLDFVLVGAVGLYALYVIVSVVSIGLIKPSLIRASWVLTWPNDLLVAVLMFEAILLFRTALNMGQGYIARVWASFSVAIFLTWVESLAHWLAAYGYFPYPENSILWYVWFLWAAALALGPAYMVDAIKVAKLRAANCSVTETQSPTGL